MTPKRQLLSIITSRFSTRRLLPEKGMEVHVKKNRCNENSWTDDVREKGPTLGKIDRASPVRGKLNCIRSHGHRVALRLQPPINCTSLLRPTREICLASLKEEETQTQEQMRDRPKSASVCRSIGQVSGHRKTGKRKERGSNTWRKGERAEAERIPSRRNLHTKKELSEQNPLTSLSLRLRSSLSLPELDSPRGLGTAARNL